MSALLEKKVSTLLTEQEKAEQAALRREYIDSMKASLRAQLDNTVIIDEYGHHKYLKKN